MNNKHEQDELKELIDEGFQSIDREVDESTPSLQWFEQLVEGQQEQLQARFKRDMILFLLLACCLLTVFSLTLFQMPILFLLLQVLIFAGALIFIGWTYTKKVKRT
ncbi:YxlC family protein [Rossellomorea vietnamensis]|uniref:YxlC family protein n=1 Tax=Rossellomorea vietnamensis TaxID=218284 RepID=UPI00077C63F7|nr:YxlC family protein [Rossellomorea vietnamensis]